MSKGPSLSYAGVPASAHYTPLPGEVVSSNRSSPNGAISSYEELTGDDLILDPSCSCCCSCARRSANQRAACCSCLNFLLLLAVVLFCLGCGAVIYSINLLSHLLALCQQLKVAVILIPLFTGILWLVGVVLMLRSYRHRKAAYQKAIVRASMVQEARSAGFDDGFGLSTVADAPTAGCNGRKVARYTFITFFWFAFLLLNVIVLVTFSALLFMEVHTLPKNSGSISGLAGLHASAKISRTEHGVLHISSSDPHSAEHNDYDVFFAQGIAHAQERLWQMEFQRAVGYGRLGELTGYNDKVLAIDKLARTMNWGAAAQSAVGSLTNRSQAIIQAYCDGVNQYLHSSALTLPVEFYILGLGKPDDWQPADVVIFSKLVSYMLSGNIGKELLRWDLQTLLGVSPERVAELLPKYDNVRFPIVLEGELKEEDLQGFKYEQDTRPSRLTQWLETNEGQTYRQQIEEAAAASGRPAAMRFSHRNTPFGVFREWFGPSTASNNWVVSGNRTATGFPLLCNDPHLQLMAPSIWIVQHMSSPSFHASGASFVGVPGVIIGHNANISWAVTNVGADVQDLFIMKGNETHYEHKGVNISYTVREEVIRIKHHDDVVLQVRDCVYGPVISDLAFDQINDADLSKSGPALALRWVSLDATDNTFDAFLGINTASNWEEFQDALRHYKAPSQNMIYADRFGNIGYTTTGVVPIRPNQGTGLTPVPGTGEHDWAPQYAAFEDMPRVFRPKKGYFASANNQVVPDGYKVYLTGDWDAGSDGYRALRITQRVSTGPLHTVASMRAIQQDYHSTLAADFCTRVLSQVEPLTAAGQALQTRLLNWNYRMAVGSVEAQLFTRWYQSLSTLPSSETNQTRWADSQYILHVFTGQVTDDPHCSWNTTLASPMEPKTSCLAFAAARLDELAGEGDHADERWGDDCHPAKFEHQILGATPLSCIANRQVEHGGDFSTINVGTPDVDDPDLPQTHGPSYRQIIDWSDVQGKSQFIYGPGQSGNILSGFYDDLISMWTAGSYLPLNAEENVDSILTLYA